MHHQQNVHDICKNHLHRYVLVQTTDQQSYDGIVENVDETNLYLAVPASEGMQRDEENNERLYGGVGFGYPGYFYPPYPYGYPSYGYPFFPRRRFQRLILPLAAITALSLLPYY